MDPGGSESAWNLFIQMFPRGLDDPALLGEAGPGPWRDSPAAPADVLGRCLWDVFSNNHEAVTESGDVVDLGSFRASAGFIADFRTRGGGPGGPQRAADYLDFYLGSWGMEAELLVPIYALIFRRMRSANLDWRYHHPRLYLFDFSHPVDDVEDAGGPEFERRDPSQSVARDIGRERDVAKMDQLRSSLEGDYRRSVEEAGRKPPPPIVRAYRSVHGRFPEGWPPA